MNERTSVQIDGYITRQRDGRMIRWADGQMDKWKDGEMNIWMDEWIDRQTNGQICRLIGVIDGQMDCHIYR